MTAEIIKADGTSVPVGPEHGKVFTLEECQKIVGGYIEVLELPGRKTMVLNEEGKLKDLPVNPVATEMARGAIFAHDVIVGDVLVCDNNQLK